MVVEMLLQILRIIGAILLIFFLPGFMFINALFPLKNELDEEDDMLYRIVLGMALSIVLSILVGFFLNSLGINPDTGKGYFDTPYILAGLVTVTVVFFVIGYLRGAYPRLGRSPAPVEKVEMSHADEKRIERWMERWKSLKAREERYEEKIERAPAKIRRGYEHRLREIRREEEALEEKIEALEAEYK